MWSMVCHLDVLKAKDSIENACMAWFNECAVYGMIGIAKKTWEGRTFDSLLEVSFVFPGWLPSPCAVSYAINGGLLKYRPWTS